MTDAESFLNALAGGPLDDAERLILNGFVGDPNKPPYKAWEPLPWRPGDRLPFGPKANVYVAVSSFGRAADGTFRRRRETFLGGRALMVDDVGTKIDAASIHLKPSAIVETSPDNQQWWYFFSEPERDQDRMKALIDTFILNKLLGKDPGMAGANRVGRLPGFTNGKARYGGDFRTRLVSLDADWRFTTVQLLRAFGLNIRKPKPPKKPRPGEEAVKRDIYNNVEGWLRGEGYLKSNRPNLGGWQEMTCPWVGEHTDRANTGAGLAEPSRENGWTGAFRCHHTTSCSDRGWRELTDWIAKISMDEITENDKIEGPRLIEKYRRFHEERKTLPPAKRVTKLPAAKKTAAPGSSIQGRRKVSIHQNDKPGKEGRAT